MLAEYFPDLDKVSKIDDTCISANRYTAIFKRETTLVTSLFAFLDDRPFVYQIHMKKGIIEQAFSFYFSPLVS